MGACTAFCTKTAACLAVTYEQPAHNVSSAIVNCYWKTSTGGFTPSKNTNCVANGSATMPSCSPLPGEMGLGGYYGHYQGRSKPP